MVPSVITLVTVLLVGATIAVDLETVSQELNQIFQEDDFESVTTKAATEEERKKRSATHVLGNNLYGNDLYANGCGAVPAQRTTFVRCFTPSTIAVQRSNFVRTYYRQGNYGQCLNYFNALPLDNVARIATGYTGTLTTATGRAYTVSACQRCYAGNPGIRVVGNTGLTTGIVRQFIFRPQINNINYNTIVADGGYGTGYGYGAGYNGLAYGGGSYLNGYGANYGYLNGGRYVSDTSYVNGYGYGNGGNYVNVGTGLGNGYNGGRLVATGTDTIRTVGTVDTVGTVGTVGHVGTVGAVGVVRAVGTAGCVTDC
ncbi:hypothetical protein SNE40_005563 [Patella caerulea]|uniref:Uncharacterized protein n=1 Tax=Patella caerulea TaxID=87958 RepID=A0AAN8K3X1_PATCE